MTDQRTDPQNQDEAWLVLGPVHLIHGTAALAADDAISLVSIPPSGSSATGNTVVVSWSDLDPAFVATRTIAGEKQAADHLAELFCDGLPAPGLVQMIRQAATAPARSTCVPLFYLAVDPDADGFAVHVYSQIRFPGPDACFLRITDKPLRTSNVEDLDWLPTVLEYHQQHAQFLNSHERHFQKWRPEQELEFKYTLDAEADIYRLAVDVRHAIHDGQLPDFMLRYRHEFECWDVLNVLFEVTGPPDQRGYVSFIPTSDGAYVQKQKWFTDDAVRRRERVTYGVVLDTSLEDYVQSELGLQTRALPSFRRVRYDVNLESARTGTCFGIMFDRCTLLDAPERTLVQCELEYTRSRTLSPPTEHDVFSDMEAVACWLETFLGHREPGVQRGVYSKLSFLRDVTASH
ncbi:hypothetical protein [Saccharopolyspora sp. ASAGF58]|uniref:hypothetical protein n=1 Tax=Saccharopolyspora sp. ASAGF58 TaxID=2719023 RepID=UPI00143FEB36|nr:hypothetical protein [Saccharopolyspora sp. ASAGF58]QIZ37934.1 hypothetical protein FDZ84_29420 [Saccharopolyspora sp. ASAGF58]